jgi:hypothetical protein
MHLWERTRCAQCLMDLSTAHNNKLKLTSTSYFMKCSEIYRTVTLNSGTIHFVSLPGIVYSKDIRGSPDYHTAN